MVATAIDVTGENEKRRAVRQTRTGNGEFFKRAIVVAATTEEKIGTRKMRLGQIGTKPQRSVDRGFSERDPLWS